jgi:uroporphyrin-III C-methyltransferase
MVQLPETFPSMPEFLAGEVWLIGAGPGDPRLLTMMALHALGEADVVVHDALVDPRIVGLAKPGARVHHAGKRGGKPSPQQRDINELIIAEAKKGLKVARLKGGDPFVFGRGGEEALALVKAGVPFRVVPGLTSGLSGPALAGIPATTRETNHAIILAAGHRATDAADTGEWEALARTGQPIVLYMAMAHLEEITQAFQRGGLPADTPTTFISSASLEGERILETRLGEAAAEARAQGFEPPTLVVVGSIAGLRSDLLAGMVKT